MLAPACRAPQNLGFVRIKLQPIWFHPCRSQCHQHIPWPAMKVHPQQQADTSRIPAYHRRKDVATDHGVQSARSVPRRTRRTELVPAQNPEAHCRWGKRWLIAQTRGVHTDAGLTGRTETIDEHCHQCQKLSARNVKAYFFGPPVSFRRNQTWVYCCNNAATALLALW